MKISRAGRSRRPVIIIGPWAFKFAHRAVGRRCNTYETKLYRSTSEQRKRMLYPVYLIAPWGWLLIVTAAKPIDAFDFPLARYGDLVAEWDYRPGRPTGEKLDTLVAHMFSAILSETRPSRTYVDV